MSLHENMTMSIYAGYPPAVSHGAISASQGASAKFCTWWSGDPKTFSRWAMWIVCGDVQGPPSCSYQHVLNLYFHRRAIISRTLLLYQLSTLPCLTARGDLLHSPPSLAQLLSVIQVRSSGITSVTFSRTFPATRSAVCRQFHYM